MAHGLVWRESLAKSPTPHQPVVYREPSEIRPRACPIGSDPGSSRTSAGSPRSRNPPVDPPIGDCREPSRLAQADQVGDGHADFVSAAQQLAGRQLCRARYRCELHSLPGQISRRILPFSCRARRRGQRSLSWFFTAGWASLLVSTGCQSPWCCCLGGVGQRADADALAEGINAEVVSIGCASSPALVC